MVKLLRLSTGMFIVGEKKAGTLRKPMLVELKRIPNKNEMNVMLIPPFIGMVDPSEVQFHLPSSEYFEVKASKELENMWRKATTGLALATIEDIKNIKKADK